MTVVNGRLLSSIVSRTRNESAARQSYDFSVRSQRTAVNTQMMITLIEELLQVFTTPGVSNNIQNIRFSVPLIVTDELQKAIGFRFRFT